MSNRYRSLPGVDHVLSHPIVEGLLKVYDYSVILDAVRNEIETARQVIFGTSSLELIYIINGLISTIILLFLGLLIFNRVEKTFLDTV